METAHAPQLFPPGSWVRFWPNPDGCSIASNVDLSKLEPSDVPPQTLEIIRRVEAMCKETKDEIREECSRPGQNQTHAWKTKQFDYLALERLKLILEDPKMTAKPDQLLYGGYAAKRLLSGNLKLKDSKTGESLWFLLKDEKGYTKLKDEEDYTKLKDEKGYTKLGKSVETAYKAYLESENNGSAQQSVGLSNEDGNAEPPTIPTPAVASELPRSSSEETPSIAAQPIASPLQTSHFIPRPSLQSHMPPQDQANAANSRQARVTSSALTAVPSLNTVPARLRRITVPVWSDGCGIPQFNSESHSALQNPHVQDALSLSLWYCQSKKASQDPSFARQAMSSVFALTNSLLLDVKLELAHKKVAHPLAPGIVTTTILSDTATRWSTRNPYKATCSCCYDLRDAPGWTYRIPDRLSGLKQKVDVMMSEESRTSATPA
jgi:hypothetical protein